MPNRFLIAGLVAATPAALLAHHSTPLYDMKKTMTVEGPLTDVKWTYPHATAKISWQKKTWMVTFPPVSILAACGLTKEILESARTVTIIGNPRKDGKAEIRVARQILNGKSC